MAPPLLGLVETHGLAVHVFFLLCDQYVFIQPSGLIS